MIHISTILTLYLVLFVSTYSTHQCLQCTVLQYGWNQFIN